MCIATPDALFSPLGASFFFSSRRRHTRFDCDWSSDVCSSDLADLILLNYKCPDFVGHKYGPESEELRVTLAELDRQVARVLSALEAKIGKDYLQIGRASCRERV